MPMKWMRKSYHLQAEEHKEECNNEENFNEKDKKMSEMNDTSETINELANAKYLCTKPDEKLIETDDYNKKITEEEIDEEIKNFPTDYQKLLARLDELERQEEEAVVVVVLIRMIFH
uniref:Uncharacterized protein n=1 Tax=Wuchereria bancrofti TaxID=6293 RepID=A0A1I8EBW6_WUCBA